MKLFQTEQVNSAEGFAEFASKISLCFKLCKDYSKEHGYGESWDNLPGGALWMPAFVSLLFMIREGDPRLGALRDTNPRGRRPKAHFHKLLVRVAYDLSRANGLSRDEAIQAIADYDGIPEIKTFNSAEKALKTAPRYAPRKKGPK